MKYHPSMVSSPPEFKLALAARERDGDPQRIRIAHWMIAWTLRALGRLNEALEIQPRLERECDEAGEPDPYVFEELELLYEPSTTVKKPNSMQLAERRRCDFMK